MWRGFKDKRATIEIDLTKSEEELWNNCDKSAKRGVKKAEKEGLIIKEIEEDTEIKKFYEIYKQTCFYGGINPESFEEMIKHNPLFFLCYYNDKVIAGSALKIENKNIFRLLKNASNHESLKLQPNNLLYWYCIKWGKEKGFKIFDLGGYQLDTHPGEKLYNVNKFKERWGGEIKEYPIYSYNLFYIIGRKLIRKSKIFRWFWDRIKRRPIHKI